MNRPVEMRDGKPWVLPGTPRNREKDAALAVVAKHEYEDVILHEEFAVAMNLDRSTKGGASVYGSVMVAVKMRATERLHKLLKAVPGVGYRILHPRENSMEAAGAMKSSARRMRKAVIIAATANESMLTDAELATKAHLQNNIALIAASVAREGRSLMHVAQTNTLPYNHEVPKLAAG